MQTMKQIFRSVVDPRIRDSLWALRIRGDISVLSEVVRGSTDLRYPEGTNQEHLSVAMDWLCKAQDVLGEGGVSAFYDLRAGTWGPPYPETTGYIIPTFYDYAAFTGNDTYRTRAIRMADWLLKLQLDNGAFPIGPLWPDWERIPIVFDTGQIIHGLVRAFEETRRSDYLNAARRAGDWLVEILDVDGCWRKFTPSGYINTFNVRTAWALLRLHEVSQEKNYRLAAVRNLQWALTQQDLDGWFCNAGFTAEEDPLTHTIAYTIRGLLESGILLSDQRLIDAARLAADALRDRQFEDGYLKGRYGAKWRSRVSWSCLTGNVQMAINWLRFFEITGDTGYVQAASTANHYVKQTQSRHSRNSGLVGGIAGSFPIYGDYEPYRYLNWAAKFLVESLLLEARLERKLSDS